MTTPMKLAVLAALCLGAWFYWSPHQSCVRAQLADKTLPVTEAEAHLICGRWLNQK